MARAAETSLTLLETAERLFAERGIEHVSLRQIVLESGQRNVSALHYHFGSREALVSELLNLRLGQVNERRNALIDRLLAGHPCPTAHQLLSASFRALCEVVRDTGWGASYIQVLVQATFSPRLLGVGVIARQRVTGLRRVRDMLLTQLGHLPPRVARQRLVLVNDTAVYSIAHWSRLAHGPAGAVPLDTLLAQLTDFCTAGLLAPGSAQADHSDTRTAPTLATGTSR
ncbi:helix-turn-helix transcriptional regulator [Verticiella sediminum]|uniref:Helix-turn-helix transcriptional regulator n=1 Tax=Verticiella sediminum TaxID=1247510 RepID=A0A556A7H6_9BURK|nr:TetR/AcrR family transcriptional regulator [Verticiella sediminum]TSH88832.1 helix-turn-helix transcriptional regulator [Verticiella sediminum]